MFLRHAQASGVDWTAIAGIMGTLGGALIGAVFGWRAGTRQLRYHERTRFHDRRLEIYSSFLGLANDLVSRARAGSPTLAPLGPNMDFLRTCELVRLVSTPPVRDAAAVVQVHVAKAVHGNPQTAEAGVAAFNIDMRKALDAMRLELGVEETQ